MSKKRRRAPGRLPGEDELKAVYITEYEITSDPIQDRFYKRLHRKLFPGLWQRLLGRRGS